jgi:hypothetical protein
LVANATNIFCGNPQLYVLSAEQLFVWDTMFGAIAESKDGGATWTEIAAPSFWPGKQTAFKSIACQTTGCLVGGFVCTQGAERCLEDFSIFLEWSTATGVWVYHKVTTSPATFLCHSGNRGSFVFSDGSDIFEYLDGDVQLIFSGAGMNLTVQDLHCDADNSNVFFAGYTDFVSSFIWELDAANKLSLISRFSRWGITSFTVPRSSQSVASVTVV